MIPVFFNHTSNVIVLLSPDDGYYAMDFLFHHTKGQPFHVRVLFTESNGECTLDYDSLDALKVVVTAFNKIHPQVWGFSPSRVEIPILVRLALQKGIHLGVLGQNPAPGRGVTYHKEFMEYVWNAGYGVAWDAPLSDKCEAAWRWTQRHIHESDFKAALVGNVALVTDPDIPTKFRTFCNVMRGIAYLAEPDNYGGAE
jgi:hypothetical protein